jgi:hypothetical protein
MYSESMFQNLIGDYCYGEKFAKLINLFKFQNKIQKYFTLNNFVILVHNLILKLIPL